MKKSSGTPSVSLEELMKEVERIRPIRAEQRKARKEKQLAMASTPEEPTSQPEKLLPQTKTRATSKI